MDFSQVPSEEMGSDYDMSNNINSNNNDMMESSTVTVLDQEEERTKSLSDAAGGNIFPETPPSFLQRIRYDTFHTAYIV